MNPTMHIIDNIAAIRIRILRACEAADRSPDDVSLMAVSKTRSANEVAAALAAGIGDIGENYLQEALTKQSALQDYNPRPNWHFIGPIQSNKTRDIATHFDWVHSVDRIKIARRLSEQRDAGATPLNLCIQVNINSEDTKAGVSPAQASSLIEDIAALPRVRLRGLMAIPEASNDPARQRHNFARVREMRDQLQSRFPDLRLDTLSMGMSGDLEAAIAEGATIVRIGTDIFGPRASSKSG